MFFVNYERGQGPWMHTIDPRAIIRKLSPYTTPDKSGFLVKDRILLVQAVNWNTPSSLLEPVPLCHAPSETAVVSWARIDNGEELARSLDIPRSSLHDLCDSELILHSYLKWGEDCASHLIGDFVFVVYDGKRGKIVCGRDHMGVRPFYYFLSNERFVCATSLAALIHPECVPSEADEKWICEYLCGLSMSFDRTCYRRIYKLPPAHSLSVTAEGSQLRRYFELSAVEELRLKDSREYVDAYRDELERAVKCRLRTNYALGSELSGGLDSSTVTAYAAKFFDRPLIDLHAFAFANRELEPRYIQAVGQASTLQNVHIFKYRPQPHDVFKRAMTILGYPVEIGVNMGMEPAYRLAEDVNVRTLLSGLGGDEFVTTIHGNLVPLELLNERRYRDLYRILPGNALFRFLRLAKLQLKEIQARCAAQSVYNPRFYEVYLGRLPHLLVHHDLVAQYNLTERFLRHARFDAGYTDLKRFTLEQCWQPYIQTRMEVCTLIAAARKIEYRWPLVDVRLVKLFMSIPSEEHYYRGIGRYLHRRAVAGTVPDIITWNNTKYMGNIVDGDEARNQSAELSMEILHPELVKHIEIPKLQEQLAELSTQAPVGVKLWQVRRNLRMLNNLNLWMQQYVS